MQTQGQEYPPEYDEPVQANAGLGVYNSTASAFESYNPNYPPLAPHSGPYRPMSGSPDGTSGLGSYSLLNHMPTPSAYSNGVLGKVLSGSPLVRAARAVSGLGDDAASTPAAAQTGQAVASVSAFLVAAVAVGLVATGVGGYYVGKAVAPSSSKEVEYAWWGVAAALVGGPIGLGIEALVALNHKGG